MTRWLCYSACALVSLGVLVQAQAPGAPPKVLRIIEETVKVGKGPAHEKLETTWSRTAAAGKWPGGSIGMKAIAGPPVAWWIEGYDSMAALEKNMQDSDKTPGYTAQNDQLSMQDGDNVSGTRTIIATYREDLSYVPANAPPVPKLRYMDLETFQTRPGHATEFVESRRLGKAAHEQAKMPDAVVIYAVVSGAPQGTFLRFRGLQSLGDEDRFAAAHTAKAYQDAVGTNQKRIDELTSASVNAIQQSIFQFDPKWTYMPKEFTSQDPDFWTPKPKPAASNPAPGAAPSEKPKK